MDNHPLVIYVVDRQDRLQEVGGDWGDEAEEQAATALLKPDDVIGRPIWEFVRGETLTAIYKSLLAKVRSSGKPLEFAFRCDSPEFRRRMRMTMLPVEDDAVRFESQTEQVERVPISLSATAAYHGFEVILRCSICNLVQLNDQTWAEPFQSALDDDTMAKDRAVQIIWTICEGCKGDLTSFIA